MSSGSPHSHPHLVEIPQQMNPQPQLRSDSPPPPIVNPSNVNTEKPAYIPPESARYGTEEDRMFSRTIFVGNLPYNITRNELEDMVGGPADAVNIRIGSNRNTGKGQGYAFMSFNTRKEAEEAWAKLETTSIAGRYLRLDWDIGVDKKRELRKHRPNRGPADRYEPRYRRRYDTSPYRRRSRSPRRGRSRSPPPRRHRSMSPRRRSRSPGSPRRHHSPKRRNYSPRRHSPSPLRRFSRSPRRSPRRRTPSPRYHHPDHPSYHGDHYKY